MTLTLPNTYSKGRQQCPVGTEYLKIAAMTDDLLVAELQAPLKQGAQEYNLCGRTGAEHPLQACENYDGFHIVRLTVRADIILVAF